MNRFFYLWTGLLSLVMQETAGQGQYLVSGDAMQPHICVQRAHADTGKAEGNDGPRLYLLSGDEVADVPVAGEYHYSGNQACYQPLYPLATGQRFLLRAKGCPDSILATGAGPAPPEATAGVVSVYPLTDSIPENILFFHVRFTAAMNEDQDAWKKISIRDDQGAVIPLTWRQRSFWLDSGRLLVLMIHPGRVKSGIRYAGPVFAPGRSYSLVVDSTLTDAYGRELERSVVRSYKVVAAQKERLQACGVTRRLKAGSQQPILIRFCNGVDHAAACTGILMYDVAGKPLACTVQQYEECTVSIQPHAPWPRGKLRLELTGVLYDCAGNRMNRLFEMKNKRLFRKDDQSREFRINAL